MTIQYSVGNHGWELEVEYDFYYKVSECKEEWIGEDLYWDWDWIGTEVWKHTMTIKTVHEDLVATSDHTELQRRLKELFDVKSHIAREMRSSAIKKAKELEGIR